MVGKRAGAANRSITIHDIARAANVSKTTVSRVLNGSGDVAPATRSRVLEAVAGHGYQVNSAARALRTNRSGMVGLLVPSLHEVFAEIAQELDKELSAHGIGVLITMSEWETGRDLRALEALRFRGIDAVVASLADDRNPELSTYLRSFDRPLILLDREVRGVNCDAVLTDQRGGVTAAVGHLHDSNCRIIGLACMSSRTRPGRENLTAYLAACERFGIKTSSDLVFQSDHFDRRAGQSAANQLLSSGAEAILALGPMGLVAGVLERLEQLGLHVPADISVVGYDENELALVKPPRMTVIGRSLSEIGRLAGQMVMLRLADASAPRRVEALPTRLIVHESTGPARREQRQEVSRALSGNIGSLA